MANFDLVDASPEDVRNLARALDQYRKQIQGAGRGVRGALSKARWNDARKAQFETRLLDLQKRLDGFADSEVEQMIRTLHELARRLDDAGAVRM